MPLFTSMNGCTASSSQYRAPSRVYPREATFPQNSQSQLHSAQSVWDLQNADMECEKHSPASQKNITLVKNNPQFYALTQKSTTSLICKPLNELKQLGSCGGCCTRTSRILTISPDTLRKGGDNYDLYLFVALFFQ